MGSAIIYGARNVDEKKDNGMGRASREAKVSSIAREVSVCMIIFASSLTLIAATLGSVHAIFEAVVAYQAIISPFFFAETATATGCIMRHSRCYRGLPLLLSHSLLGRLDGGGGGGDASGADAIGFLRLSGGFFRLSRKTRVSLVI